MEGHVMEQKTNFFHQLLIQKEWRVIKDELGKLAPQLIVQLLREISPADKILFFRLLPRIQAKETFECMTNEEQKEIINGLVSYRDKVTNLLNDIEPDDRTAFFEELPGEIVQHLIQLLSKEEREITMKLLGYPKDSVGRLMTPKYIAVKKHFTATQALAHIRKFGQNSETFDVIYIVDQHWKLIDDIDIKTLILASPRQTMSEIGDGKFIALSADTDQENAIKVFRDYDCTTLPVIDNNGTLLGIVTVDDIIDIAEEEGTEDFQKFGGNESFDLSYTHTPLLTMVRKRAGWLIILFLSEMLTASAMGYFDQEISKAVVLALFVPLIISSGGNSGSQAASLIIRSLAIDELSLKNWWYVMRKAILSGFLLGSILGAIGFIRIFVWQETGFYDYGEYWIWIGVSVSVSLIFIVLWGSLSGSMIPFILKRCGLDPATASAPFVATLVDVTGLIIYFTIAALFLGGKIL